MNLLEMPSQVQMSLPSDFQRVVFNTKTNKKRRTIPQLGEQPNQSVPPLKVLPRAPYGSEEVDMEEVRRCARECGVPVEHLLSGHDGAFSVGEVAWKYELGKSLVRPAKLGSLTTYMRQLHTWYMQVSQKKESNLMIKIRDEHFFRDDSVCIDFQDLFDFYNLDALDKAIVSAYCL